MNIVNTTYNSSEDRIIKKQSVKGKTKLKFYTYIHNFYDAMKNKIFQFDQDPFPKNAEGISKFYYEVLLLMNFLQTKTQVKNVSINY